MSETRINQDTGEVIEDSNSSVVVSSSHEEEQERPVIKWNGMFSACEVQADDRSNHFQDQFEEVPPFTKNEKGEWINDSSQPLLIPKGKKDVDEYIQSFKDEVDIYKILEKVALTGDESLLYQRDGFYGDVSVMPDNIHDVAEMFDNDVEYMRNTFTKEEINAILNDEISSEDIGKMVADRKAGKQQKVGKQQQEVMTEEKTDMKESEKVES